MPRVATRRLLSSHVEPAPVANGLLNNLISFWPGDEMGSGDLLDCHVYSLHLIQGGTITTATGVVYATARQYVRSNSSSHARAGDDALLSTGNVDFTLAAWCYTDTQTVDMWPVCKWTAVAGLREYGIRYVTATDRFGFIVRNAADAANVEVVANTLGAVGNATWYFVVAWHDSLADTINIQINNGGVDTVALVGGLQDSSSPFSVGGRTDVIPFWDGRIGPVMFWKSAPGGGGVLTTEQRTALYNNGAGLAYSEFDDG